MHFEFRLCWERDVFGNFYGLEELIVNTDLDLPVKSLRLVPYRSSLTSSTLSPLGPVFSSRTMLLILRLFVSPSSQVVLSALSLASCSWAL